MLTTAHREADYLVRVGLFWSRVSLYDGTVLL